jgi:hypothetical protein
MAKFVLLFLLFAGVALASKPIPAHPTEQEVLKMIGERLNLDSTDLAALPNPATSAPKDYCNCLDSLYWTPLLTMGVPVGSLHDVKYSDFNVLAFQQLTAAGATIGGRIGAGCVTATDTLFGNQIGVEANQLDPIPYALITDGTISITGVWNTTEGIFNGGNVPATLPAGFPVPNQCSVFLPNCLDPAFDLMQAYYLLASAHWAYKPANTQLSFVEKQDVNVVRIKGKGPADPCKVYNVHITEEQFNTADQFILENIPECAPLVINIVGWGTDPIVFRTGLEYPYGAQCPEKVVFNVPPAYGWDLIQRQVQVQTDVYGSILNVLGTVEHAGNNTITGYVIASTIDTQGTINPVECAPGGNHWRVGCPTDNDFEDIQSAIDSLRVKNGDTIEVCNGRYRPPTVIDKQLTFIGGCDEFPRGKCAAKAGTAAMLAQQELNVNIQGSNFEECSQSCGQVEGSGTGSATGAYSPWPHTVIDHRMNPTAVNMFSIVASEVSVSNFVFYADEGNATLAPYVAIEVINGAQNVKIERNTFILPACSWIAVQAAMDDSFTNGLAIVGNKVRHVKGSVEDCTEYQPVFEIGNTTLPAFLTGVSIINNDIRAFGLVESPASFVIVLRQNYRASLVSNYIYSPFRPAFLVLGGTNIEFSSNHFIAIGAIADTCTLNALNVDPDMFAAAAAGVNSVSRYEHNYFNGFYRKSNNFFAEEYAKVQQHGKRAPPEKQYVHRFDVSFYGNTMALKFGFLILGNAKVIGNSIQSQEIVFECASHLVKNNCFDALNGFVVVSAKFESVFEKNVVIYAEEVVFDVEDQVGGGIGHVVKKNTFYFVDVVNAALSQIEDNEVDTAFQAGLAAFQSNTLNNRINNALQVGLARFSFEANFEDVDNHISNVNGFGYVSLQAGGQVTTHGNVIENVAQAGVQVQYETPVPSLSVIEDSSISCSYGGGLVTFINNTKVYNNHIDNVSYNGIEIESAHSIVEQNSALNVGGCGIVLDCASTTNTQSNNVVDVLCAVPQCYYTEPFLPF